MYFITLVLFVTIGYLPPFFTAADMERWVNSQHWGLWGTVFHRFDGLIAGALLVAVYGGVALVGALTTRVLWPDQKPRVLQQICMPDQLGGLNLLLLLAGVALTVVGLRIRAPVDIIALGIVTVIAVLAHFREMANWQYRQSEAIRRRWVRGL